MYIILVLSDTTGT